MTWQLWAIVFLLLVWAFDATMRYEYHTVVTGFGTMETAFPFDELKCGDTRETFYRLPGEFWYRWGKFYGDCPKSINHCFSLDNNHELCGEVKNTWGVEEIKK